MHGQWNKMYTITDHVATWCTQIHRENDICIYTYVSSNYTSSSILASLIYGSS